MFKSCQRDRRHFNSDQMSCGQLFQGKFAAHQHVMKKIILHDVGSDGFRCLLGLPWRDPYNSPVTRKTMRQMTGSAGRGTFYWRVSFRLLPSTHLTSMRWVSLWCRLHCFLHSSRQHRWHPRRRRHTPAPGRRRCSRRPHPVLLAASFSLLAFTRATIAL